MRIDVTRAEFEVIVDALKGQLTRAQAKLVQELAKRLDWQLHPSKAPDSNGWAPIKKRPVAIRSSWPSGHVKPDKKKHWSYDKEGKPKKAKQPKAPAKPLSADEILAGL
jgi:hypothetical protein